ncbi:hypothetical protein [Paracoccus luteus]|uniref:hypothetical protein n=1 Tax=Paracoccus luteus TaxID=2508543 RepID=UPI0010700869|nr:hypothetical protein [Paracoccus luteus]
MSECRRTCWIAAALMGLLVLALTSGAGDLGVLAGLLLGLLTAGLVGGLLVFLACEGRTADQMAAEDWASDTGAGAGQAPVAPGRDAQGVLVAPPRPAAVPGPDGSVPMTGAPPGASVNAAEAVTFTVGGADQNGAAVTAPAGGAPAGQAPEPPARTPAEEAPAAKPSLEDTPAEETPLEDTRAVMYVPSQSEDHAMPGEAVPAAEPMPAAQPAPDQPPATITDEDFSAAGPGTTDAGRLTARSRNDRDAVPQGADDLGRIDGVGRKLTGWLHENGVTRFDQIAAWTDAEVDDFSARLARKGAHIRRDDWVGQARVLAAGGETAHSRRVDAGDAP